MGPTLLLVILATVIIVALIYVLPAAATAIRNIGSDNRELTAAKSDLKIAEAKNRVYEKTLREIILNPDSSTILAVSAQDEIDTKELTTGGNR